MDRKAIFPLERNRGEIILSSLNDMQFTDRKYLHTVRMSNSRTVRTVRTVHTIYRLEKLTDRNLTFTDRYSAGVLDNPPIKTEQSGSTLTAEVGRGTLCN